MSAVNGIVKSYDEESKMAAEKGIATFTVKAGLAQMLKGAYSGRGDEMKMGRDAC
jgi:hypothetical protein